MWRLRLHACHLRSQPHAGQGKPLPGPGLEAVMQATQRCCAAGCSRQLDYPLQAQVQLLLVPASCTSSSLPLALLAELLATLVLASPSPRCICVYCA